MSMLPAIFPELLLLLTLVVSVFVWDVINMILTAMAVGLVLVVILGLAGYGLLSMVVVDDASGSFAGPCRDGPLRARGTSASRPGRGRGDVEIVETGAAWPRRGGTVCRHVVVDEPGRPSVAVTTRASAGTRGPWGHSRPRRYSVRLNESSQGHRGGPRGA